MRPARQGPQPFFVAGGTLKPDTPSYIERQADQELYERCLAGEYCWVLTTRQMGKSSLMARTARRLRGDGVRTAVVDLSTKSKGEGAVSADQWYYGIAHTVLRELEIRTPLEEWWRERSNLPAVQRLVELIEDVVLPSTEDRVVVFFDEIDSTLDLAFADDFFAAIRGCFNARATTEVFERLSFVLLGTATPQQLIADPTRTPFNIGRGIDLTDFTLDEARPLAKGIATDPETGEALLRRVLYWTDGHPYMTQALCRTVAERLKRSDPAAPDKLVDGLVEQVFLEEAEARDEKNLRFVADRLTAPSRNKRRVLATYRRIRRGKTVQDEPRSSVHAALKLSGVVKRERGGELTVRNRIYERVFTPVWVKKEMPAEPRLIITVAVSFVSAVLAAGLFSYFNSLPQSAIVHRAPTSNKVVEIKVRFDNGEDILISVREGALFTLRGSSYQYAFSPRIKAPEEKVRFQLFETNVVPGPDDEEFMNDLGVTWSPHMELSSLVEEKLKKPPFDFSVHVRSVRTDEGFPIPLREVASATAGCCIRTCNGTIVCSCAVESSCSSCCAAGCCGLGIPSIFKPEAGSPP